jgi:hypothetical protein
MTLTLAAPLVVAPYGRHFLPAVAAETFSKPGVDTMQRRRFAPVAR